MSDPQNRIPSFNEVMHKQAPPKGVPSFEDIMGDEPPKKKGIGESVLGAASKLASMFGGKDGGLSGGLDLGKKNGLTPTGKTVDGIPTVTIDEQEDFSENPKYADYWTKRGYKPVDIKSTDPVKESIIQEHQKLFALQNDDINANPLHRIPAMRQVKQNINDLKNPFEGNAELAEKYFNEGTGVTKQKAAEALQNIANINNAINTSPSIEDAAVKYQMSKDALVGEQSKFLGKEILNEVKGAWVDQFNNNIEVLKLAENNPDFKAKIDESNATLYDKYPEYAIPKVINLLAQEREDRHMSSLLANNPSVEVMDKLAKDLLEKGHTRKGQPFTEKEYKVWSERIIPALEAAHKVGGGSAVIPTTGAVEMFGQGIDESVEGIKKSIQTIGAISDTEKQDELTTGAIKKQYAKIGITPSGEYSKVIGGGAHMIGFVAPMIIGGAAKIPHVVTNTLMFLGVNDQNAKAYFPGNAKKQIGYTALTTGADVALAEFLPINKVAAGMKKSIQNDAVRIINDFTDKKITVEVAKKQFVNSVKEKAAKAAGWSEQFLTNVAVDVPKNASIMTGFHVIDNAANAVFGGRDISLEDAAKETLDGFTTNLLSSIPLSALSSFPKSTKIGLVMQVANDPAKHRELVEQNNKLTPEQKQESLDNINLVEAISKKLEGMNMPPDKKGEYLQKSLEQSISEKAVKESPDKALSKEDEKRVKIAEIEKEHILSPMSNTELLKSLYDHLPKNEQNALSTEGKFDENKVGEYLKEVAQQVNNMTEGENGKWKENETQPPKVNYPESIKEAADKRWKAKIEEAYETEAPPTPEPAIKSVEDEKIKLPKGAKEVFHYSENESLNKLEDREGGTWFTDNGYGYQRRPGVKGKVSKVIEPDNLNLATEKQVWTAGEGDWANGVKKIKEQGFDGIKQTVDGDKHYLVFDLKNVKDKADYAIKETPKAETPTPKPNTDNVGGGKQQDTVSETEKFPTEEELANGEIPVSIQDAETRLSNGERLFAAHEMDEVPIEVRDVTTLRNYAPDQLIAIPRKESPFEKQLPTNETKPIAQETTEGTQPKPAEEIPPSKTTPDKEGKGAAEVPPGEPPKEGTVEGEGEVAGITHAANEVRRKDRLLPEYEKTPQSFEQWNNEAEKAIKEGYDVEKLMDEIEAGKDPNPVENAIRKIYIATLDAEIAKDPTDALLAKQKRFIEIGDLANSRAGRNLASLKGEGSPLSSISDFYVAKMEAAGVDKLTEQQKKETKDAFDKVQKADENATAAMEAYREEIAKLKAENELLKQKKETKPKKEKGDWAQQRKDAVAGAREALKKLRIGEGGLSAVPLPGVRELIAIAPHVKKYVGALLGEGVHNLKQVVTKAYEEFKDMIDGLTEKDIHNIIAGEYNEVRPTRNELAAKMRDLMDEAYYINKLERLLKGEEPKNEKAKVARNRQITELREKIKDIQSFEGDVAAQQKTIIEGKAAEAKDIEKELTKAEREETKKDADAIKKKIKEEKDEQKKADLEAKLIEKELKYRSKEEIALQQIKTRNERETAKIKERIAKGDFETKKQVPFLEDPEMQRKFPKQYKAALDAIVKREDARHEFDIALLKDQMAKRGFAKKYIVDLTGDILGTTRALTTGIDASGVGIQNIVAIVSHPRSALKALPASFGDFISAERQERWLASVHSSELFPLAQKFGLDITEPKSLKASEREEIFTHNLLDKRIRYNYNGKEKTFVISKYTTKPFERIFIGLGNRMRWNLWQRGVDKLYEEGYTPQKHPEEFESLAKVLNTETGRGTLHPTIKKGYDFWSSIIWSPRLMASRMNILGIGDLGNLVLGGKKGYYGGLTPRMREYALKDLAKFVIFGSSMLALAGLTFADDTDIDPNSAGFGTFTANGKTYNIWGGFTQYVRLMAALKEGGEKRGGEFKESNQLKTALRFLWGKTTPVAGTTIGLLNKDQKDYMGVPLTTEKVIENLTIPLSIRGIVKGVAKEGGGSILWTGVPSFIGMNVSYQSDFNKQSQGNTLTKEDVEKYPVFKEFSEKGIRPPEFDPKKIATKEVLGKETQHLSDYPKEIQDKFISAKKKYWAEELQSLKNGEYEIYRDRGGTVHILGKNTDVSDMTFVPFKNLTPEEIQYLSGKSLSGKATRRTKEEMNLPILESEKENDEK